MMSSPQTHTLSSHEKSTDAESAAVRLPLRVLLVEDNDDDVAIVLRLLRRGGYEPSWAQVQTAEALTQALEHDTWDVVLSDYNLPQFDGLRALHTARSQAPHLPFIVISGSIGEETAVEVMRAGANDYLMKTNLVRLVPAIARELRESAERRERARTKRALLDLQEKFEVIFDEYLDVMMVLDSHNGDILHANQAVARVMGYDARRLLGQSFVSLWPEAEKSVAAELFAAVQESGSAFRSDFFRRLDGSSFPVDMQANKVHWGRGGAIIVTLRDISEHQRAEQRLADEKEQLAVTLRSIGEGVITADTQGRLMLINGVAEHLTGWTQAEVTGRSTCEVLRLAYTTGGEPCEDYVTRVLQTGTPVEVSKNLLLRSRDGRERLIVLTATPIRGHGGQIKGVVTIFRDSTSEQKREEELQKASRLESVALLAGGIAHDFNNILTTVLGHIALAKNRTVPPETVINTVEKGCLYATDLTRQLLSFAKGSVPNRRVEPISEIIQESVDFGLHGTRLRCVFDLPDDLLPVEVDRNQIHQVINNLVINAAQATRENGTLRVSAHNVSITYEQPVATLAPGRYVQISIQDNGSGIPPEHLSRIFDPYFTTKEAGSGLGLASAYSIIKKHDGLLQVESEVGQGTTFFIYLPAHEPRATLDLPMLTPPPTALTSITLSDTMNTRKVEDLPPSVPGAMAPDQHREKYILFMDDEEILQELVSAMLSYLGYEVVCASDGVEAIEHYQRARAAERPFSIVMVDLTVPGGMGGFETVQRLRALDPDMKAVVSSGYSNDPILANYKQHGFSGVIAKPYQMAELDKVLQEVIDLPTAGKH